MNFSELLTHIEKKEFYIRFGNSTRLLDSEETYKYIEDHWR